MAVDDVKKDSICGVHQSNKVVLYCKSCEELICSKCVSHGAAGVGRHQGHVYLDLVEAYDICKEEMEKLLAGFKDDLQTKRIERQELHTKLQKLQLALLRKKTELGKATRSLKDCLCRKEKAFLGEVDAIINPAIAQCEQRFKDVEFDVLNGDGSLASSEAIQKLPPTRILSYLKGVGSIKHELSLMRRRTFTEYDEDSFNVQRLDSVHLTLQREKHLIDRAFAFPTKVAAAPRVLPGWCVIAQTAATLTWKYSQEDTVKQFHVYVKPVALSDRKYTSLYERRTRQIVIKQPKKRSKQDQSRHPVRKTKAQSKRSDSQPINERCNKQPHKSTPKTEPKTKHDSKSSWFHFLPWRKSAVIDEAATSSGQDPQPSADSGGKDDTPSWYVVEPVSYVQSLSGEEQEIHDSLSKSIALTEALKRRSQGLKKKSSVSDQYLYTPVFRAKSTSLFGSKEARLNQTTIKEQDSEEKLDQAEKDIDTSERSKVEKVTVQTKTHSYTAIDISNVNTEDFNKIKISKFIPGRIQVVLRDLRPGRSYMALLTAVNHCGESEATVVHFTTASVDSPSVLDLACKPPTRMEYCKKALGRIFQFCIFLLGMSLYALLVFYLLSYHVTQRTCDVMVETLAEVDTVSMRSVCPHLSDEYACGDVTKTSDSWIRQAVDYFNE